MQSNDEIIRVMDEYSRVFAPEDLLHTEKNAETLLGHSIKAHGVVTISTLIAAEKALGTTLDRKHQPTAAELADKAERKMRKDFADSLASKTTTGVQKLNAEMAAQKKKEADEVEFKQLLSLIEHEISSYIKGHSSGVTDYTCTETGRNKLREVRDVHPRRNIAEAKACLAAVRKAKAELDRWN